MLIKYILLVFTILVSNGYGYMTCKSIGNVAEKCECYARKETNLYSKNKENPCLSLEAVAKIVRNACKNVSYCRDAYAKNDDHCPLALFNYHTSSCREACLKDIEDGLDTLNGGLCVQSFVGLTAWYCNDNGWGDVYKCDNGWRLDK